MDDRRVIGGILHVLKTGGVDAGGRASARRPDLEGPIPWPMVAADRSPPRRRPGSVADISTAAPSPEAVAAPGRSIADRAYDADGPRRWLAVRGIEAAILSTATRTVPDPLGRRACARHKSVERLYCRAKNRHCLATRCGRLARRHLAAGALVAAAAERAERAPT